MQVWQMPNQKAAVQIPLSALLWVFGFVLACFLIAAITSMVSTN